MKEICFNCFYWLEPKDERNTCGNCRRSPKQVSGEKCFFPHTFDSEWCGEWKLDTEHFMVCPECEEIRCARDFSCSVCKSCEVNYE